MKTMARYCLLFSMLWLVQGCGRAPVPYTDTWHELILELLDADRIARLDTQTAQIVTSSDPTGGNDDFNQYLRESADGWWVVADLEGPGYISRFWFTGAENDSHRVRFYFDDEKTPRIDMTIGEFCGGEDPFLPPLAVHENYCWYNLIPIPYEERVVVMVEPGAYKPNGWPRIFYQINYHDLPERRNIASFPKTLTADDRAVIADVRRAWRTKRLPPREPETTPVFDTFTVAPGAKAEWSLPTGPAVVREWVVAPEFDRLESAVARENLLRELVLNVYWNDAPEPSISAPMGDVFGVFWRRNRYESLYVGSRANEFFSRLPMPYAEAGRIELVNESDHTVTVRIHAAVDMRETFDQEWGYLHADWQRTTPADVGRPHVTLSKEGRGKFVGTMLAVVSADRSWWILEADERIRVDDEREPGWEGTGLEDYFNGGWYYQNAIVRLLTGIPMKMPFRVLQYRFHLMDPVHFDESIDVTFERGPDHNSRGWMESMAYYYMDRPTPSTSDLLTPAERMPPDDGFGQATIMSEINNLERIGDYQGAHDFIDYALERYPDFPFTDVLRLRQLAYIERRDGFEVARPLYEAFLADAPSARAAEQAGNLLWFHESLSNALLSAYCNMRTAVFFNGTPLAAVESAEEMTVFRVEMNAGENVVALQSRYKPYPGWVQLYLRTHAGDVYSSPSWKWRFEPRGSWTRPGFDDASWPPVGGTGVKGPPEVPHVGVVPHAYVNMQSLAVGLRPPEEWPARNILVGYRHAFEWPRPDPDDPDNSRSERSQ